MSGLWNILIVDDEVFNLEIICEYLEDGPYTLKTAENGAEAWDMITRADPPFDLIVLDRMMPVMDGMELLQAIKADPRHAQIPVIMQTAANTPQQIREGLAAGCYYYLTKPYKSAALNSIIASMVDELRGKRQIADALRVPPPIPATNGAEYTFSTIEEAHRLSTLLATQCPDPAMAALGLLELLLNAVEHGNLGISYALKKQLKMEERWEDEIAQRLQLPQYQARKALVQFARGAGEVTFTIIDQGDGFDWQRYLDFDPERVFDPNGRGIAMAGKMAFSQLEYRGRGNHVVATVRLR